MIDSKTKSLRDSIPWGLVLMGVLLSLSISISLTEMIAIKLIPQYVMPILGVWIGYRHGWAGTGPMLVIGGLAIIGVYWELDWFTIGVGCDSGTYFLALLFFAMAALQSDIGRSHILWQYPRRQIALWVAIFSLSFGVFSQSSVIELPIGDFTDASDSDELVEVVEIPLIHFTHTLDPEAFFDKSIELYQLLGILSCFAALLCMVDWRMLARQHDRKFISLLAVIGIVLLIGLNIRSQHAIYIDSDSDSSSINFLIGLFWPSHWLFALCFFIAVVDALDWRFVCAALVGMFFVGLSLSNERSTIWEIRLFFFVEDGYMEWVELPSIVSDAWTALRYAICAVLLGAALHPFVISFKTEQLRMAKFLSAVLVVYFFTPGNHYGYPLIVSFIAFSGSLVWGTRGLIVGPFIILLCEMVSYGFSLGVGMHDLSELAIVFPAAFLGLIVARRLAPQFYIKPIVHTG